MTTATPGARAAGAVAAVGAAALVVRLLDGYPLPATALVAFGLDTLLRRVGFVWGAPEAERTGAWVRGGLLGLAVALGALALACLAPGARVGEGRFLPTAVVLGAASALVTGLRDELLGRGLAAWVTEGAPPALRLAALAATSAAFGAGAGGTLPEVVAEGAVGLALGALWHVDGHGSRAVAARVAILFASGTLLHGNVAELLGASDAFVPPRGAAFGWAGAVSALTVAVALLASARRARRALAPDARGRVDSAS